MTNGTSQGLYVIVAVVIFGIFTLISYLLFQDSLTPKLTNIFETSLSEAYSALLEETDSSLFTYRIKGSTVIITDFDATNVKNVVIPRKIEGMFVTEIDSKAFYKKGLETVVLPEFLEKIHDGFFSSGGAFSENNLKKVVIPDKTTYIGNASFHKNKIDFLVLGKNTEYIGKDAFEQNKIKELNIPNSVKYIGYNSFGTNGLKKLAFKDLEKSNLEKIDSTAFRYNSLSTVQLPRNIKEIATLSFWQNPVTKIVLPEELKNTYDKKHPSLSKTCDYLGGTFTFDLKSCTEFNAVLEYY